MKWECKLTFFLLLTGMLSGTKIRYPEKKFIPDPDLRGKKAPDPGSGTLFHTMASGHDIALRL
jgi:hypothetical protein